MYLDIPRSEEELSVEVGFLDDVHVCDGDLPLRAARHAHHRPVLQHLTANGPCTHQEVIQASQFLLKVGTKHSYLAIVPAVALKHTKHRSVRKFLVQHYVKRQFY